MDKNIDEKTLSKYAKDKAKPSYNAHVDDNGKLFNDICNNGLEMGQIAVRSGGEYNGFAIKATEYIRPVLTNIRVSKAIKMLSEGNIQGAIVVLTIADEVMRDGIGVLYAILKKWLEINDLEVPNEYIKKANNTLDKKLLEWVNTNSYAPVLGSFEVANIGYAKDHTIVPENWLGRKFKNATELHNEMDRLPWRKGKPPVNYCAIYVMDIEETKQWVKVSDDLNDIKVRVGISMFPKITKNVLLDLDSQIQIFSDKKSYQEWLHKLPKNAHVFYTNINDEESNEQLMIACDIDKIFYKNPTYEKKRNVGLLVSTLQKLIRRGKQCSVVLYDTLKELWNSPGYNLPDQQFLRVNACRQLAWRVFISTIEDVEPYIDDVSGIPRYLSMKDIACLAIIANVYPDVKFIEPIFDKLALTALLIQHNDAIGSKWDLLTTKIKTLDKDCLKEKIHDQANSSILIAIQTLLYYMPMRSFDSDMINKAFNYINQKHYKPKPLKVLSLKQLKEYNNKSTALMGELAGYDMHPYPHIILMLQASLPQLPNINNNYTTQKIAEFIWNNSSNINVRNPNKIIINQQEKQILDTLINIQKDLAIKNIYQKQIDQAIIIAKTNASNTTNKYINHNTKPSEIVARTAFILLFGQKFTVKAERNKKYDIIVAGTHDEPCKVKSVSKTMSEYIEGIERYNAEKAYINHINKSPIEIDVPLPPPGYKWIFDKKKVKLSARYINNNNKNKIVFMVDKYDVDPFDASKIIVKLPSIEPIKPPKFILQIIEQALYINNSNNNNNNNNKLYDDYELNLIMYSLSKINLPLYDWFTTAKASNIPPIVWRSVYVKLFNNYDNEVQIGPVDSMGNKLQNSISYLYEGTIWRIFNLLSMLYPTTIINKSSIKSSRFQINPTTIEYIDLIEKIKLLMTDNKVIKNINLNKTKIITKLWDHQLRTSERIIQSITKLGRYGFGDASNVGAGKTLTALSIMSALFNYNVGRKDYGYKGFLVLLPSTHLYDTWITEIEKHTEGFHIVIQNANGTLSGHKDNDNTIKHNTILVTTLGRVRDHPLSNPFILVIIDECLSVQNKNALQTEEAWRQILSSQYRAILLSATFFRARFDVLYFLLKMLGSGLPENKQYLDAILSECIVSFLPSKTREWTVTNNGFELAKDLRKKYDTILSQDINSERLYLKLQTFLFDNFDYTTAFNKVANKNKNSRCLIYAKSKDEADKFAVEIEGCTRFPDITGRHVCLSYTEGTYGLNNLIHLNTIVTRPPEPDKLPQMKGRLDRPGQKSDKLYIEYVYIDNTIENASLFRLELANNFFNNYILPLAEFYDIATGRKQKIIKK